MERSLEALKITNGGDSVSSSSKDGVSMAREQIPRVWPCRVWSFSPVAMDQIIMVVSAEPEMRRGVV